MILMSGSNPIVAKIETCEVCLSKLKGPELDFGYQPLCDELKASPEESLLVTKYHQNIILCEICFTAHQKYQVPKKELFKPNYHYRASLTKDVLNGMEELANSCSKYKNLNEKSVVLDVGCNDGSLLSIFKNIYNVKTIGVDPTDSIDDALDLDLKIKDYFSSDTIEKINEKFNKVDVITFTNVFAHIEDLTSLIVNLKKIISDETLIVIENHYLGSIIEQNQFDTFYHEHPRTYSIKSFDFISNQLDVSILDILFPKRYGGNIRVIMSKQSKKKEENTLEDNFILSDFQKIQSYYESWNADSKKIIDDLISSGSEFNGKSLPGRGVMLINSLDLSKSFMPKVFEQNFSPKVGNYVPGTDIYIDKDENINGDNLIIWSWHVVDEIIYYLKKIGFKGSIWKPLPRFEKVVEIS
tara:strand:+ start:8979 stop:10214 length:1236 start_codon:yes stop_codon:yes gene_type:complete